MLSDDTLGNLPDSNSEKTSKLKRQDSSDDYHDTESQRSPANSTAQGELAEPDMPQENQKVINDPLEIEHPGSKLKVKNMIILYIYIRTSIEGGFLRSSAVTIALPRQCF